MGGICATSLHGEPVEGVLLGAISGLAGSFFGFHLRRHLVKVNGLPDLPVALVEDGVTIVFSVAAMAIITG